MRRRSQQLYRLETKRLKRSVKLGLTYLAVESDYLIAAVET